MRVEIPIQIWQRLNGHDGLQKALAGFIECLRDGKHPPRKYKLSGTNRDGVVFQPYIDLALYHHHLHRRSDPLLIVQQFNGVAYGVALSRHADFFGDKMLWLQTHKEAIIWDGQAALLETVLAFVKI